VGVFFAAPVFIGPPYPYPYYPYPYVPAPGYYQDPPHYIEQEGAPGSYWYYCPQANGYYPYVQQCPGGWQPVVPQPPSSLG
jgi:hypothetical protein